jgi:hypothetical protein
MVSGIMPFYRKIDFRLIFHRSLLAPMVAHAVYNGSVAALLIAGALGGGF